jgi:DNA-binding protein
VEFYNFFNLIIQLHLQNHSYNTFHSNNLNIPEEYYDSLKTYYAIKDMTGVDVIFNPTDLHSIETLDDIALRFKTKDGVALGDGGNYSCYANRWDKKITNFYSVATGVEAIERNKGIDISHNMSKLAVYCIDASNNFVLSTLNDLYDIYDSVIFYGETNNISKAIKNAQKNCTHFVALGKREEMSQEIEIKDLCKWTTERIKVSNGNNKNRKKVYKCQ